MSRKFYQKVGLLVLVLVFGLCSTAWANVYYVDGENGYDENDGTNWVDDAFQTIGAALQAASSDDEIWVRAWTYNESITLKDGVAVYGGFDGTETLRSQRDYVNNVTVIDGTGYYHVVVGVDNATIDGFTITGGNANGTAFDDKCGGGMYNNLVSPTVVNCIFTNNSAMVFGGGMYNRTASPIVTNCTFSNNTITETGGVGGGGMCNYDEASPVVTNCTFTGNMAVMDDGVGGGMFNKDSSHPTVTDCVFSANSAKYSGGMGNESGFTTGTGFSPIVTNCIFSGNTATANSGALGNISGSGSPCSSIIRNCFFLYNAALGEGGAMRNQYSDATMINCTFMANEALSNSTIHNSGTPSPTFINCIMWGNTNGTGYEEINNVSLSNPTISYSDIEGCFDSGGEWKDSLGTDGGGNIDLDPSIAGEDYHLQADSPCIDAGNNAAPNLPSTDIEGDPRIAYGTVDMGVDEYYGGAASIDTGMDMFVSPTTFRFPCAGYLITITDSDPPTITAANDLRITIPANLSTTWDITSGWTEVTGTASGKIDIDPNNATLVDDDRTIVVNVLTDFAAGDTLIFDRICHTVTAAEAVSGETGHVGLSVDGDSTPEAEDTYTWTVAVIGLASLANQTFQVGDPPTEMSPMTITEDASNTTIKTSRKIYLQIPSMLKMTWDTSITTATITGPASAKVSTTVTYNAGADVAYLSVTENFAPGDIITVSGLRFTNFTEASSARSLTAETNWFCYGTDDKTKEILAGAQYTLTVNTAGSGGVTLDPTGGVYDAGTEVQLTAIPVFGWSFTGWSGDLSGAANPTTITMTSNKTVTATFSEVPPTQYDLTVNIVGQGSVTLEPPGGVYNAGTEVNLRATPSSGWVFSHWSGSLTGSTDDINCLMNADRNITANFIELSSESDSFSVTLPAGTTTAHYRILSIPLMTEARNPVDLLGPQIGTYDTTLMRIAHWENPDTTPHFEEFNEFEETDDIEPGDAAWFLFRYGKTLTFEGTKTPTAMGPGDQEMGPGDQAGYFVNIFNGWNQIGNPFNFAIDIDSIIVLDSPTGGEELLVNAANEITQRVFWVWVNGDYEPAVTLPAGTGGWVKKLTSGSGSLFFPAVPSTRSTRHRVVVTRDDLEKPPAPPMLPRSQPAVEQGGGSGGCFIQSLEY